MRRHWSERLIGILGAVWFVLLGIEPAVFGACPAHGLAGAVASHAGHGAAIGHMSAHQTARAGHDGGAPAHDDSHQCTCPGSCCAPTVMDVPSAQPGFALSATFTPEVGAAEQWYRAAWTDFVLPFATAPPQSPPA